MEFEISKKFDYENGFYLTSEPSRFGRFLAHYELFKIIEGLEGDIVECGVFKGASFMRFAGLVNLFKQDKRRNLIGFDTFGEFPTTNYKEDKEELEEFIKETNGGISIGKEDLSNYLNLKDISNFELIKGDICKTVPNYVDDNKKLKIALLNIDVDIYEPVKVILDNLADKVVKGGIIIFDDYGVFKGETKLANEYARENGYVLSKFDFSKVPYYLIKK